MKESELRRTLQVLPMGPVMTLTGLSARQIRYYETQNLVIPARNDGNRRLYSLNDIDRLLDIKELLAEGNTISNIKEIFHKQRVRKNNLSDERVRLALEDELKLQSRFYGQDNNIFGLPRF